MPIQRVECFVPHCDECGEAYEEDYIVHYETEAEAWDRLLDAEWVKEKGDKIVCSYCREKAKGVPA